MVSYYIYRGCSLEIKISVILLVLLAILFSGCVEKPNEPVPVGISSGTVPSAPKQMYLHPNTTEKFNYLGHEVLINYKLQNSSHDIELTIDGIKETITKSINEQCSDCAYFKKIGNITYVIRPLTWKTNEIGEKVWSFDTWNTNELYFEMILERIKRT